jgi:predicted ATPase/DNA-binding SARP family transcriptional activator
VDRLADQVWPGELPTDVDAALQTLVFRLRKALPPGTIETSANGYRLAVPADDIDARRFADAVAAAAAARGDDPATALAMADEALSWWRDEPYADLADDDEPHAGAERERLRELHAQVREERLAALIDLGEHRAALADLFALVQEQPLRERPRSLLMTALAASGRAAEASRQFDEHRLALAAELGLEPSDSLRRLHDAIVRGEISSRDVAGPARSRATTGKRAIPRLPRAFVGRDELVSMTARRLRDGERLLTLIGTGGVGKTTVAAAVAHRLAADGAPVWFCELAQVDGDGVDELVAEIVGVEPRSGRSLIDGITDALGSERGLLVLDNCEHVLDRAALLADAVLTTCPDVALLVTSRERLEIGDEVLCPIAPFPVPESPAVDDPVLQLFLARARAVRSTFELDDATVPLAARICRQLDGLPLAIELAAARLQSLDLQQISAGLDHRFRLLTTGDRTNTRQRSLAAAVAWSYELLSPDLRAAFDLLGVFAGAFSAIDAAEVLDVDATEANASLAALVGRSLLQRTAEGHFALLETLRHYALDRLASTGMMDAARERHAEWALAVAERSCATLTTAGDDTPLAEPDRVLADLRAARRWWVDTGAVDSELRLVVALDLYGFFRMRPEVLAWGDHASAVAIAEAHPLAPRALSVAALGAWKQGDLTRSGELARDAVALAERLGQPDDGPVFNMLGVHALVTGSLDEARACFERGLATEVAASVEARRVILTTDLVLTAAYAGAPDLRSLADGLVAMLGPLRTAANAFAWYAAAEAAMHDDLELARRLAERALTEADATGAWFVIGVAGALAASIDVRLGALEEAIVAYRWLLPWWRRAGELSVLGTVLRSTAELLARLERDELAALLLGAVTVPDTGHGVFGGDAVRLGELATQLEGRLGGERFEAARSRGARLGVADAAAVAEAELETIHM